MLEVVGSFKRRDLSRYVMASGRERKFSPIGHRSTLPQQRSHLREAVLFTIGQVVEIVGSDRRSLLSPDANAFTRERSHGVSVGS